MSSPFSPVFYTIKHVLLTFDAFVKLNFAAYLITLHFGGKQGVRTAPASSILHSSLRSLFSWLPPFSIVASKTVDIKTSIFLWNTNLPPLCLNSRPQSFQRWITLCTGQISIKQIVHTIQWCP